MDQIEEQQKNRLDHDAHTVPHEEGVRSEDHRDSDARREVQMIEHTVDHEDTPEAKCFPDRPRLIRVAVTLPPGTDDARDGDERIDRPPDQRLQTDAFDERHRRQKRDTTRYHRDDTPGEQTV